jgi:DnaA family protein
MRQLPLPIAASNAPTFATFLRGGNDMAVAHLRELRPGSAPVYLWGPQGCGKTHLLQAASGEIQARGGRVGWFGATDTPPWDVDPNWSLLVLDNCDAFNQAQQHAAFAGFVEASTHGIAVACAGRLPPVDLALREDLRSRLGWGHVLGVVPLSEVAARAALRQEADRRGLFLSDEVIDHLLNRFARDLKNLMIQLDRLDQFSLVQKRAITVPLLRQMLAELQDEAAMDAGA